MLIYLYTRVSTSKGKQTTDNQLLDLRAYCKRMQWGSWAEIEEMESAGKTRPKFEQLQEAIRAGKVDILLAWKLDRVARSLAQFVLFAAECAKYKTRLIIPGQGIDTDADTPTGRLQMNILMSFAEFERDLIRDRVNAGIARAKAEGKQLGRARIVVDRMKLWEMKQKGMSYQQIATKMGLTKNKVFREVQEWEKRYSVVVSAG